jgi:hypothetical protein
MLTPNLWNSNISIEILIKVTLIFWDAADSESIGTRDSITSSKPAVKLEIFKEIYAACKNGRMNCTVTELIALTFCIITLSTVIGWEGVD